MKKLDDATVYQAWYGFLPLIGSNRFLLTLGFTEVYYRTRTISFKRSKWDAKIPSWKMKSQRPQQ